MKFHTFTDELKKLAPNSPSGGANVVQKGKRKMQVFEIKHLHFVWYPEPGSNRHGLLHWCLRPARLPIPPSGLVASGELLSLDALTSRREDRHVDVEGGRPSG